MSKKKKLFFKFPECTVVALFLKIVVCVGKNTLSNYLLETYEFAVCSCGRVGALWQLKSTNVHELNSFNALCDVNYE